MSLDPSEGPSEPPTNVATPSPTVPSIVNHEMVGIGSLLFVFIIVISLVSSKIISRFNIFAINESTISIVLGLLIGIIITFFPGSSSTNVFSFDSEFFFFVLLPPIVFEAGFGLKRKHFFRNMTSILMFAVIGTMISTIIIAFGLYSLSYMTILPEFGILECLLFGTLISAVDPVGTLSVLGKKELNVSPMLYSLIFGESVLNDAVTIVLYKIFSSYNDTQIIISFEKHFFSVIGEFCGIFIGSCLIGLVVALFASAILRYGLHYLVIQQSSNQNANIELQTSERNTESNGILSLNDEQCHNIEDNVEDSETVMTTRNNHGDVPKDIIFLDEYRHNESDSLKESPSLEFSIIILFAYLSYNLGEVLSLSGIVAVFSCGICMSHYAWYNLTWITQISLHHIIVAISKCCENFVYVFLGISCILSLSPGIAKYEWNLWLILFTIALCLLSRAANIFPLSALSNMKRKIKISFNMQIMMFFSGLRGAIAFALALNLNTPNADLIITTTLTIVILTTVCCGCTTKYMLDKLDLGDSPILSADTTDERDTGNYYKLNTNQNKRIAITDSSGKIFNMEEDIESPTFSFSYRQKLQHIKNTYTGLHKYWGHFDKNYMQQWFGGSTNPYKAHNHIGIYSNRKQAYSNKIIQKHARLLNDDDLSVK